MNLVGRGMNGSEANASITCRRVEPTDLSQNDLPREVGTRGNKVGGPILARSLMRQHQPNDASLGGHQTRLGSG